MPVSAISQLHDPAQRRRVKLEKKYCSEFTSENGISKVRQYLLLLSRFRAPPALLFGTDGHALAKKEICRNMSETAQKRLDRSWRKFTAKALVGYVSAIWPLVNAIHVMKQKDVVRMKRTAEWLTEQEKKHQQHSELGGPTGPATGLPEVRQRLFKDPTYSALWTIRPTGDLRTTAEEVDWARKHYTPHAVASIRRRL